MGNYKALLAQKEDPAKKKGTGRVPRLKARQTRRGKLRSSSRRSWIKRGQRISSGRSALRILLPAASQWAPGTQLPTSNFRVERRHAFYRALKYISNRKLMILFPR